MNALTLSNGLAGGIYLLLAGVAAWRWRRGPAGGLFVGALAATAGWLAASAWLGPEAVAVLVLDALRAGTWLGFLAQIHREGRAEGRPAAGLGPGAISSLALGAVLAIAVLAGGAAPALGGDAQSYGHLLVASAGLVLVESLLRHARPEALWRIKHLCIAAGLVSAYDLFLYGDALLFHRLDALLASLRGGLFAVVSPLLVLAAARNPGWTVDLHVSRRAALQTVSLVAVGIYLLALGTTASLLGSLGADWGPVFQMTFLGGAAALLAVVLLSGTVRSRLSLSLRRAFFTHRYDYRDEWAGFVEAIASPARGASLGERALRAVLELMDSPQGAVWLLDETRAVLAAQVGLADGRAEVVMDERWRNALGERDGKVVELRPDEGAGSGSLLAGRVARATDRAEHRLSQLPESLGRLEQPWLLMPLVHRDRTVGFSLLARPRAPRRFDWEDRALLEIVATQLASYLAEDRASRSLEETQRFAMLARRTSFIAHDLRNLSNELALTLANARRHIEKPDFQRDLLVTMEETVARMMRLLERLHGAEEEGADAPTDLAVLVREVLKTREGSGPRMQLAIDGNEALRVGGPPDALAALVRHLVQNAADAAGDDGSVRLRLSLEGGCVRLEVADDGPGMEPERAREHLLHPFTSPAPSGFGIGLYQCRELSHALGGGLGLETAPGRGTVARVDLPLAGAASAATSEVSRGD